MNLLKLLKIPNFRSYEEFLASSWLAIRIASLTVLIMAIQSMKVIQAFSLYSGIAGIIHSVAWTSITAFAILHFTVKLSRMPKTLQEEIKMRRQLGKLILLFSFIEFLLGMGYHIIWFNLQANVPAMTIPELTPAFFYTAFLDLLLPVTLYFYGHTVHIKTKAELDLEENNKSIKQNSKLKVEVPGFGEKELIVKEIN